MTNNGLPHFDGHLEVKAEMLEASGDYRVLRRLKPRTCVFGYEKSGVISGMGIMLDTETTGLDPNKDEVIELAMVPFFYGEDGGIYAVGEPYQSFNMTSKPIPDAITKLTGISNEMVEGHAIDTFDVGAFIKDADIIIAHNAGFDRKFVEGLCQSFERKSWGCSQSQVAWAEEGFSGTKLGYLLNGFGLFHDAHRAVDDCHAAIEILARILPVSGVTGLSKLLAASLETTYRLWALGAPFSKKDMLKDRGYRWNDGNDGRLKSWFRDVNEELRQAELEWLQSEIFGTAPGTCFPVTKITAKDRFSGRV